MRRLLVTGAGGFLGWHLCRAAASRGWEVHGVAHRRAPPLPPARVHRADLTRPGAAQGLLARARPDAVIHAAAEADTTRCQRRPAETRRVNVDATEALAAACARAGARLVVISSDMVFDGEHAPYGEGDPVGPLHAYGRQKVAAERRARARHPGVIVCRLPLMFGAGGAPARNALQAMVQGIRAGRTLHLFHDEHRTPVSGAAAAEGLLLALEAGRPLLHLGGPVRLSRLDFGRLVARAFGLGEAALVPISQRDVSLPAPRPRDISLDSRLAFSLGYAPPSPAEELARMAARTTPIARG